MNNYTVEDVEVIGFNTKDNVVVLTGTKVVIEKPEPANQYGQKLTVYVDVTDKDDGHVTIHTDGEDKYTATVTFTRYNQSFVVGSYIVDATVTPVNG